MPAEPVCSLDELSEGVPTSKSIGRRRVVLTRWRGDVYACHDSCAHMGISFEHGSVGMPVVGASPRDVAVADRPVITCPRHQFQYDLHTGTCIADPHFSIRLYPVTIDDGVVFVNLD